MQKNTWTEGFNRLSIKATEIWIDDRSTDSSFQICQDYAGRDPRIQVFQKENGGVSSARNFGLSQMTGQWFMTMDADDYMAEDAILMLYEAVKQSQAVNKDKPKSKDSI